MTGQKSCVRLLGVLAGLVVATFMANAAMAQVSSTQPALSDEPAGVEFSPADEQGRYVYLVRFAEPGLLERQQRASGERFNPHTPAMAAAREELQIRQANHVQSMAGRIGRSVEPSHYYLASHSGLAVRLTPAEADSVRALPEVVAVERERVYQTDTYRGPEFMGAGAVWDGSAVPDGSPLLGENMVSAVLDTGVSSTHPSFANDPACGHGDTLPDKLLSSLDCSSTDASGVCNGPAPEDVNSHGSHVASTVAGNVLDDTADPDPGVPGSFNQMSGVAPCASIRSYTVCPDGCPGAQIQAGMDSVLLAGDVDVMNFSISGGASPWNDNDRRKLDLVDAGIFVAASAGNTSDDVPNPVGNVNHRGPWVMSVAASTRDTDNTGAAAQGDVLAGFSFRGPTPAPLQDLQKPDITAPGVAIYAATVGFELEVSGPQPVPEELEAIFMNPGSDSPVGNPLSDHSIRFDPNQPAGEEGCDPGFPSGFFDDAVALIQRGTCPFTEKINNAVAAGADLVVIWNNEPGGLGMLTEGQDPNTPAFGISQAAGQALLDFIDDNPTATINYSAEIMDQYGFIGGTSMSSPHVAGAGLLVRQANPDWTPSEVKSALQMTASRDGFKENGTTSWDWDDVGSGRADLTGAALAGLVMDETFQNYLDANPTSGGDVKTLNLPALRNLDCSPECSWTRTVRNTLDEPSSWSVTSGFSTGDFTVDIDPASFDFTGDTSETQTITVTIAPAGIQSNAIHFGEIIFTEADENAPEAHWTLAVSGDEGEPPVAEITPDSFDFTLPEDGSTTAVLTIANVGDGDLTYSIDQAEAGPVMLEPSDSGARGGGSAPVELILDEGFPPGGLIGVGPQEFLWFNQFTPNALDLPFTLEEVQVAFLEAQNPAESAQVGDEYDVHVWSAPDGDPTGTVNLLTSVTGQTIATMNDFNTIVLPGGGVEIDAAAGDVLIGVVNRVSRDPHFPAASDSGVPSQQRSWVGFGFSGGVAGDPPDLSDAGTLAVIDSLVAGRNWTIRGFGTGGSACLDPSDVSWLTVNPETGTVVGGDADQIDVAIDMTGLGQGTYEAALCIETNDPALPVHVVPVVVEVVDAAQLPEIQVSPASLSFQTDLSSPSDSQTMTIANEGSGLALDWVIEQAEALAGAGYDPSLDETLDIPDFSIDSPANGGTPVSFDIPAGVMTSGNVVGFSFEGTVSGVSGNGTWASDTCMWIEAPDGTLYSVGGISASVADCAVNDWDFQGSDSDEDGVYTSAHPDVWPEPGLDDSGDWTFTFINGWDNTSSATMDWTDVSVVLHKIGGPGACDSPSDIPWLSTDPVAGSTDAQSSSPVDVMVDSLGLVDGLYEALLCISSNDPNNPIVEVPVSLEVSLGEDAAVLEGTVLSQGYCGADPAPAAGAAIEIVGEFDTYTTTADGDGFYQLPLDANESPLTITASAPDHLDGVETGVTLVAQETTVVDFDLVLEAPCATVTPDSVSEAVDPDDSVTRILEIGNVDGGAALDWSIFTAEVEAGEASSRAHFPARPYMIPQHGQRDDVSWHADEGHSSTRSGAVVLPRGAEVPAYSTTGWDSPGYITMDALVPGSYTVIEEDQPTNFYAGAFVANDFSQQYALASADGGLPQDTLIVIDTDTGAFDVLGTVTGGPSGTWASMSWDHTTGTLFVASLDELYTLDLDTLEVSLVGPIEGGGLNPAPVIIAIAVSPEGLMYGIDIVDDVFVAIDKTTGEASVIGPLGVAPSFAQDMDFDQTDGTLYWAGYFGGGNSQMLTIDLDTGTATSLGNIDGGTEMLSFSIALPGHVPCVQPASLPWLSVDPVAGTTPAGDSEPVSVTLDATGLAEGTYHAEVCVETNDSQNELIVVPVEMLVGDNTIFRDRFEDAGN